MWLVSDDEPRWSTAKEADDPRDSQGRGSSRGDAAPNKRADRQQTIRGLQSQLETDAVWGDGAQDTRARAQPSKLVLFVHPCSQPRTHSMGRDRLSIREALCSSAGTLRQNG
jgi:hypothetical protein